MGVEGNRKSGPAVCAMWCHDMTVVMPYVKWQPSIFAKLLPALQKKELKIIKKVFKMDNNDRNLN